MHEYASQQLPQCHDDCAILSLGHEWYDDWTSYMLSQIALCITGTFTNAMADNKGHHIELASRKVLNKTACIDNKTASFRVVA